jgi:Arc/MetJ-type ribon-helix-helix transcriptional regulator
MKTVQAQIPDELERQIDELVERGLFPTRQELIQEAIRRFLDTHRPELMDRFLHEDVEWGLRGRT